MALISLRDVVAVACLFSTTASAAELEDPDAYKWYADDVKSDLRRGTIDATGNVRVSQGATSIEAPAASAKEVAPNATHWTFSQGVRIDTPQANLQATTASASFVDGVIAEARAEGSPAEFEQRNDAADRQVRGRAGVIAYDVAAGVVRLEHSVWFSNGKDEFRGEVVIYNMRDERIQINPGGQSGRVRGVIRPTNGRWSGARSESPPSPNDREQRSANESGA